MGQVWLRQRNSPFLVHAEGMPTSSIRLTDRQAAVLEWIKNGCPTGVYDDDVHYSHRLSARALASRGLVKIRGHGATWVATPTARGELWPEATEEEAPEHQRRRAKANAEGLPASARVLATERDVRSTPPADAAVRAARRVVKQASRPKGTPKTKIVEKRETYMRYRVMVTRVQVAERWVRATDEEDAAKRVQAEFDKPYGYFGSWKTTTSEVEVVEAEQTTVIRPNPLSSDGPMLLGLKDAAKALGISYSMLYELANKGEIEWTQVATRKYIARDALLAFIKENTHRGYHSQY